jgi:protease-4
MKKFLKSTLLYLLRGIVVLIALYSLTGLATYILYERLQPSVPESAVLIINLEKGWVETSSAPDFRSALKAKYLGQTPPNALLGTIVAVQSAIDDPRIKGLLLVGDMRNASTNVIGVAGYNELGQAIRQFGKTKPTFSYLRQPGMGELLLSSYCENRYIDPLGTLILPGMGAETLFYGKAFEEYGVNVQVAKVGTFKSAVEPYIQGSFSEAAKGQQQRLVDSIWSSFTHTFAENTGIKPETVDGWADKVMVRPADIAEAVPSMPYAEFIKGLQLLAGESPAQESTFAQVDMAEYRSVLIAETDIGDEAQVAVITVQGAIGMPGKGVDTDLLTSQLRAIKHDKDKYKALVLRVNSPGGGVYPSQRIARELASIKEDMPVYVSMGQYAASGGYWIAALGDEVYATPFTLTGSIGVFALTFDIQTAASNLGLAWDRTSSSANSGLFSLTAPKSATEIGILQGEVEITYGEFTSWVAQERGMELSDVELVAEGQVWSGLEGKANGLVDHTTGFTALQAQLTKELGDYTLTYISSDRPQTSIMSYFLSQSPLLQQAVTQAEPLTSLSSPYPLQSLNLTRLTY